MYIYMYICIHLPSASPPPCAQQTSRSADLQTSRRDITDTRSSKILYCASDVLIKNTLKTKRNAGFFLVSLFCSSAFTLSKNNSKSVQNLPKSCEKAWKMEAWSGSGGSWESSWRHLGPKTAQSSKKGRFWPSPGSPRGTLLGAFLAPFPLWGALGTLKWLSLGGFHFDITFLIKFWSKLEAFGRLKTLILCVRGCKNQVFSYVGFGTILGTILEVILRLTVTLNP